MTLLLILMLNLRERIDNMSPRYFVFFVEGVVSLKKLCDGLEIFLRKFF